MSWLVRRLVAGRTDNTLKSRERYEWAIPHSERSDPPSVLDRDDDAELPRLTSHGLRHTAATHMVHDAADLGELRAVADLLGHSPEMLMNTCVDALPQSQSAVVERIGRQTT